jgi:hypothetical protein
MDERTRIGELHRPLLEAVSAVLFLHDPIGIAFEDNTDEYELEAATILKRMHPAISEQEVRKVVHEELVRWFELELAGPETRYTQIAAEIWSAYKDWGSPVLA